MRKGAKKPQQENLLTAFVIRGGIWVVVQGLLMLLALVIPIWSGTGQLIPRHPLSAAGAAVSAAGTLLAVWGWLSLGRALTPFPLPRVDATLHQQGAYRLMRHPMYAGVILASSGWALWWLSIVGLLFAPVLAIFFDRKAAHEEIWLRKKYKKYADYERQVKKFIPGFY